jgi:hypothetical protein
MTGHPYRAPPPAPAVTPRWRAWLRGSGLGILLSDRQWFRRLAGGTWLYEVHVPTLLSCWTPAEARLAGSFVVLGAEHYPAAESGGPR